MEWKIPLFETYWDEQDLDSVSKIIKRGNYWATGPEISLFEKEISNYLGVKYAVCFNSGTSALQSVLQVYNISNKEVIVPSFTFIATANAVILSGGKPIFAESEEETFGLDFEDVKKKISAKTKAIILMHYGGCVARDSEKIRQFCKENNLLLIEDAAQSFGSSAFGKKAGTFGDAAMFSFCQNKVITCGEGGVIVTNNQNIVEKLKLIRSHGRVEIENEDYFSKTEDNDYIEVGYNFRMPTMSAALGLSQLKKIGYLKEKRKEIASIFNKSLENNKKIRCPFAPQGTEHVYQMYTLLFDDEESRTKLQKRLIEKGIMNKVYFNPIHLKTYYIQNFFLKEGLLPNTESLSKRVLTIPLYVNLSREDQEYIISTINELFEEK